MADAPAKFVFLSYGHDAAGVAERLRTDLEHAGYEVWYDKERLDPGHAWESHIEEGIDRAAAAARGRFLLLMTPRALRRSDLPAKEGFCLKELRRAVERGLFILPVMIEQCELPILINGLQWLDLTSCVPFDQHETRYGQEMKCLIQALDDGRIDFEGAQSALQARLRPTFFASELRKHLPRFTGREGIFAKLDRWLADPNGSRIFWLTGGPGAGKSAIAAKFEETRPQVAALHFCRFGQTDTTDARRAFMSIAYQLSTQLPEYRDALVSADYSKLADADATTVFDRLFLQKLPARNPNPGEYTVVVVDGLDEATSNGANPLADVLARDFPRTGDWLRLLITSRPEAEVCQALQGVQAEDLDSGSKESLADARAFIVREYAPFAPGGAIDEETVAEVLERSDGLFLYLEWARDALAGKSLSLERVEDFPRGLGGAYNQFFKRQFPDTEVYKKKWRPVLEVAVAAREPLEPDFLARMFDWSEYDVNDATAALGSMFIGLDGRVRPFHKSLYEWLTDRNKAGGFVVSENQGRRALAGRGWSEYEAAPDALPSYFLRHLANDLASEGRQADLERLLRDYKWIRAKLRATDVFSLIADYRLLTAPAGAPARSVGKALHLSAAALGANAAELPGQLTGRLLGFGEPEIRMLLEQASQSRDGVWMKPLTADLTQPGSSLIAALTEPARTITAMAFSPDGGALVFASGERDRNTGPFDVKLWHAESGRAVRLCETSVVDTLAFSPEGDHVVVVVGGVATSWSTSSQSKGRMLADFGDHAVALSFPDAGRSLAAVTVRGEVQTWDLTTTPAKLARVNHLRRALTGPPVALAVDAGILFSGLDEWNIREERLIRHAEVRAEKIAVTPDASRVLAAHSTDVGLWTRSGDRFQFAFNLPRTAFIVSALAISADGRRAACASFDDLRIWDLSQGEPRGVSSERERAFPNSIAIDARGERVATVSTDGAARVWDLSTLRPSPPESLARGSRLVYAAEHGATIGIGSPEGVRFRDLDSGESRLVRSPVPGECVAVTSDATRAFTSSKDELILWDLASGRVLHTLGTYFPNAGAVAVFPDGSHAAVSSGYSITVWDLSSGQPLGELTGHVWFIDCLAVSRTPAGWRIVSGSRDRTVRVWDPEHSEALFTLTGHSYTVSDVAALRDGRRALSCCPDGTLRIWDIVAGKQQAMITTDSKLVRCACSADGKTIVAGDLAGGMHFFELVEPVRAR